VEWRGVNTNVHTFSGPGFSIECSRATFNTKEEIGKIAVAEARNPTEASRTLAVHPTYSECDASLPTGTLPATVKTTGCDYRLLAIEPGDKNGEAVIACAVFSEAAGLTSKSSIVKGLDTKVIFVGQEVIGTGIPAGTEVKRVINATEIELSAPVLGEGTATFKEALTFKARGLEFQVLGIQGCAITVFPPARNNGS